MQLVQSNEVKSSCHMEKEGLIRSISNLTEAGVKIGTIVTDRHVQILKWVRENMDSTKHCVDVWHVAKGLKKKLTALSKAKDCSDILPWIKSISNHLYWVAASIPSADGTLMMQKWLSVQNHIQNVHEGHGNLFDRCCHGELRGKERRKKWLKPGYANKLTRTVINRASSTSLSQSNHEKLLPLAPPPLCDEFIHPLMENATFRFQSRYNSSV